MNDRELLELAARAAGIDHPGGEHSIYNDGRLWDCKGLRWWNALTDDGDAFRLAVFLTINIESDMAAVEANVALTDISVNILFSECNNDPYAATRRAIVRAAAAIAQQECGHDPAL